MMAVERCAIHNFLSSWFFRMIIIIIHDLKFLYLYYRLYHHLIFRVYDQMFDNLKAQLHEDDRNRARSTNKSDLDWMIRFLYYCRQRQISAQLQTLSLLAETLR